VGALKFLRLREEAKQAGGKKRREGSALLEVRKTPHAQGAVSVVKTIAELGGSFFVQCALHRR
jgi:hypothetical protein